MKNVKLKTIILVFFIFAFFFLYPKLDTVPSDAHTYIKGIQLNEPTYFEKPLLYWIALPIYNIIGNSTFFILPLIFLLISIFIILQMFEHYNISLYYFLFFCPLLLVGVTFIFQFTRDALLFCIANLFFYCMIKKRLKETVILLILATLTKVGGFALLIAFIFKRWDL